MDSGVIAQARALIGFSVARVLGVLALGAATSIAEGAGFLALAKLLGAFGLLDGGEVSFAPLAAALCFYIVFMAAASLLVRWRVLAANRLRTDFTDRLRLEAHRALLAADPDGRPKENTARIVQTLTADAMRCAAGVDALLGVAAQAIQAGILLAVAFVLSFETTLLIAALAAVLVPLTRALDRRVRSAGAALGEAMRALATSLADDSAGLRTIKMFGAESARAAAFARHARHVSAILANHAASMGAARVAGIGLSAAAVGGLLVYAVLLRDVPLAQALVLAGVTARLVAATVRVRENWRTAIHNAPAYEALNDLARAAPTAAVAPSVARRPNPLANGIALNDLAFDHGQSTVFADVAAELPAGAITLLTGPSGAGKSTFADVLAGLCAPTRGTISIDGVTVGDECRPAWRRRVGYAMQDAFLFDDTIRANLMLADAHVDEAALRRAIGLAAADFVWTLPQGLETRVGERGARLSAGERQRLCLAAALLRRPDFLILDETFAPLDPATAAKVAAGLRSLLASTTILVIAHREIPDLAPRAAYRLAEGRLTRVSD
jgi:ATP-binding cassette subfamily C protein